MSFRRDWICDKGGLHLVGYPCDCPPDIEDIIYRHTTDAGEAGLAIDDVAELASAIAAAIAANNRQARQREQQLREMVDHKNRLINRAIEQLKNITISPESDDWWVRDDINAVVRELES